MCRRYANVYVRRYVYSLILLGVLNVRCDSGGYEDARNALHADQASHEEIPVLSKNQQAIMLKPSSAAPSREIDLVNNTSTDEVNIKTKEVVFTAKVENSSTATDQKERFPQTGKLEKSLPISEAKVDINVVVPPRSTRFTATDRESIANSLYGALTGSGALAGSNWQVIVRNSSYDGAGPESVLSSISNPLSALKSMLIAAGSVSNQGAKPWNPLPLMIMGLPMAIKWRVKVHARIFMVVADLDLFCMKAGKKYSNQCDSFVDGWWAIRRGDKSDVFEIYGLLRPDHQTCGALGCRPTQGKDKCPYAGSATNIKGNSKGCYYDKTEGFTLKSVDVNGKNTFPFCGKRGVLVNPCYERDDSHKKYLGNWLKSCSLRDSSCYMASANYNIYTPSSGSQHLFNAATTWDNSASLITQMASSVKAKLAQIKTSVGGDPFIDHAILKYSESQVASVSVGIEAGGSTTPLQQGDFTVSYPNGELKVTVTNPQTNFPEGSTMIVSVTLADPVTTFSITPLDNGYHQLKDATVVTVDGSKVGFSMPSETTVALKTSPRVGDDVRIEHYYLQTSYVVSQGVNTVCTKRSNGQAVDCVNDGGKLQFTNPSQIADGDVIDVLQKLQAGANKGIELGRGAILETVKLQVGSSSCDADSLAIIGMSINIEESKKSCAALSGQVGVVTLTYDTIDNNAEYRLLVPAQLLAAGSWNVRLKIAGEEKKAGVDYVVDKKTKTLTYLSLEDIEPNTHAVVEFY